MNQNDRWELFLVMTNQKNEREGEREGEGEWERERDGGLCYARVSGLKVC
jgi:hypothetical protein